MMMLAKALWNDNAGFIVSAELILVATIAVLAMVVGLSEVSSGINQELEDIGSAFGSVNQSYCFSGLDGHRARHTGSSFHDSIDFCDSDRDLTDNTVILGEGHSPN